MSRGGGGCLGSIVLLLAGFIFGATYCGPSAVLQAVAGALVVGGGFVAGTSAYALWSTPGQELRVALGVATAIVSAVAVGMLTIATNWDHCGFL